MNCGCYILSYVDLQKEAGMNNGASGWGDHETWTSFSFASSDLDEEDENKEVKEARYVQCLPALGGGVIQKDSEFKASLSISNFISVTVMKYPGQSNNNNNNNNLVGKGICFSSQAQVTAQWCR